MDVTKVPGRAEINAVKDATLVDLAALLQKSTVGLTSPVTTRYGSLSTDANGHLLFSPGQQAVKLGVGRKAAETVKFTVNTESGPQVVQISYTVVGVNDDPISANDSLVLSGGKGRAVNLLKNDIDQDVGDRLKVVGLSTTDTTATPETNGYSIITPHGKLTVNQNGSAAFTVDSRYAGLSFSDIVSYQVADGKGGFSSAQVEVSNNGGAAAARPSQLDLISADDLGASAVDNITSKEAVTLTGRAAPLQEVKIFNNGEPLGTATAGNNGVYSFQVTLASGANAITASVVDLAGVELTSTPLVITADFSKPAQPSGLALDDLDDTGFSNTDGITSKLSGLTITGEAEPDTQLQLFRHTSSGDVSLGKVQSTSAGTFSLDVSLPIGAHEIVVRAMDKAGNLSPDSDALTVTVLGPVGAAYKPVITSVETDSGTLPAATATNDVTPTLQLSLSTAAPDGAKVAIFDGATLLGYADQVSDTTFQFTPDADAALTQGVHNLSAALFDAAGNKGPSSVVRAVEIDLTAPASMGKADLAVADDTGRSGTDNITSVSTGLSLSASVAAGVRAQDVTAYEWTDADGNSQIDDDELTLVTLNGGVVKNGVFRADIDLAEGQHNIVLTQKDLAGNESATDTASILSITVDATAPDAPSTLVLAAIDDSGASDADLVTSQASGLTITGTAEPASQVELFRQSGTNNISLGKVVAAADGSFSLDVTLVEGVNSVFARATDVAGNRSPDGAALSITVDSKAPVAPALTALASDDDTGASTSDRITSQTSDLTLSGTAEKDAVVELFAGAVSLGKTTADGSGAFSIDVSLSEGVNQITAKATDLAGNVSAASQSFKVTVDTTAPTSVTSLNLLDSDDTGASHTDNLTSQTSGLTVSAAVVAGTAPAAVTFYEWADANQNGFVDAGETTALLSSQVGDAAVNGTSFVANLSLDAGTHVLLATQKDLAGNESAFDPANAYTLTIDNVAPTQTTGLNNASQVDADTIQVTGKLNAALGAGDVIQIFDTSSGSVLLGQAVVGADQLSWSFQIDGGSAVKTMLLTANVVDLAGNAGASSAALSVIVGTAGDDSITGTAAADFIFGLNGADRIQAGDGNDIVFGGAGNDIIDGENGNDMLSGDLGDDILRGGAGADSLYGGAGRDRLEGGAGDDLLVGGTDADTLTGSAGSDIIRVLGGESSLPPSGTATADVGPLVDVVTDFVKNTDIIDLGSLQVDLTDSVSDTAYSGALGSANNELKTAGDSSYQFIDEATTTGGGLFGGGTTTHVYTGYLFVNADGAPGPDQVIQLVGLAADANVG